MYPALLRPAASAETRVHPPVSQCFKVRCDITLNIILEPGPRGVYTLDPQHFLSSPYDQEMNCTVAAVAEQWWDQLSNAWMAIDIKGIGTYNCSTFLTRCDTCLHMCTPGDF